MLATLVASVSAAHIAFTPLSCLRLPLGLRTLASTDRRHYSDQKKWSTPLAKKLFEAITTTGPVPLASYMRMCLTGDSGGYYSGKSANGRSQFGQKGDFITSPEISQIFGELVGIWFVAEWISQGRPPHGVQFIELGPGRGTLMHDLMRTIQRFPAMVKSIDSIFMVEASAELTNVQKNLICRPASASSSPLSESESECHNSERFTGRPIVWTDRIQSIPKEPDKIPFIIAHEFFDALPIHIFQSAPASPAHTPSPHSPDARTEARFKKLNAPDMEWREMLVSPVPPAALASDAQKDLATAEFQLILSSGITKHSRNLPEISPRYHKLKQTPNAIIEVCPDAVMYASDIAVRIGGSHYFPKAKPTGAALIMDYGSSETVPSNSLRGVRDHRLVNPFSSPGQVDLSADVDFSAIAECAIHASDGVEVHGPVSQANFLELMGIRERAQMLAKAAAPGSSAVENITKAWKRLVDCAPNGMGKLYKMLAILPENDGRRRPAGFGGDVDS